MRWNSLFDDLEAQFSAERALASESEIAERAKVELAGIEVGDRLRGAVGAAIKVLLVDGIVLRGELGHVGSEWLVLTEGARQWLIPLASVISYQGLGRLSLKPLTRTRQSLGIASALRALSRDRAELVIHLTVRTGDGHKLRGVIDRVGRDYFDLAAVLNGEARRVGNVAEVVTVPFGSVAAICSDGGLGLQGGGY
ncbi:hypothetical protein FQP90_10555 [Paenarthrobacter nitroguajacolicus]|uniref:Fis family transcriptional regulator n=1 Tax=Paenarthrobacter nitroguajacolicus TaxID=211146 RepID=A0A558H2Q2_PAENT|nr:hypothetical protein [Paenarthrobacter nitroguajacolicus]TVU63409.1 hypothetical protein FQP90_10555 [Paenarthrobacter nitroguajacolicus]